MTQHSFGTAATSGGRLGPYRLLATLSQGTTSTVHLAQASGEPALLAVKESRCAATALASFMDESRLAVRLCHPRIVHTLGVGDDHGRLYRAMEYFDGQPLSAVIRRARVAGQARLFPLSLQLHVLCEVLEGLQHAHDLRAASGERLKLVHGSLCPEKVLVGYDGTSKIIGFGPTQRHDETGASGTRPKLYHGNFAYAAPEQLLDRPLDGSCDVFAVGIMLWEALSHRRFSAMTPTPATHRARIHGQEPRIAELMVDVDPWLAEISDRALAVDTYQRYESAESLRRALQAYLAAQGPRVASSEVASALGELFAQERRMRQYMVDRALGQGEVTRSAVVSVPSRAAEDAERESWRARTERGVRPVVAALEALRRRLISSQRASVIALVVLSLAVFGLAFSLALLLERPPPPTAAKNQPPTAAVAIPALQPEAAAPPVRVRTTIDPCATGGPGCRPEPRAAAPERPIARPRAATARAVPAKAELGNDLRPLKRTRTPSRAIDTDNPY
ncbi:MAG: serine/threonine-protein kinase [Polyangiales bacterium]